MRRMTTIWIGDCGELLLFIRPTLSEGRQPVKLLRATFTRTFHSSAAQKRRNDTVHSSLVIIHEFFFSVRSRVIFPLKNKASQAVLALSRCPPPALASFSS